jgi:hypothetical protein
MSWACPSCGKILADGEAHTACSQKEDLENALASKIPVQESKPCPPGIAESIMRRW